MTLIESESYLFNKEVICLNELLSDTGRGMLLMLDHLVGHSWPFDLAEIGSCLNGALKKFPFAL
jgi:hypothetical protein